MVELIDLLPSIIAAVTAVFLWTQLRKYNVERMYDDVVSMAKEDLQDWLNKDGQKVLLQIGALIGAGARQGAGFGIPKGKGGLEGVIGQILGQMLSKGLNDGQNNPKPFEWKPPSST